jgi:hypothetical protein
MEASINVTAIENLSLPEFAYAMCILLSIQQPIAVQYQTKPRLFFLSKQNVAAIGSPLEHCTIMLKHNLHRKILWITIVCSIINLTR